MRIQFDDNLRGDLRITKPNNRNVLLDPSANAYDPDDWEEVILTKWLRPDQIEATYDTAKARELEGRAVSNTAYSHDFMDYPIAQFGRTSGYETMLSPDRRKKFLRVIERQHKELRWSPHFVDTVTGETRAIPTTWDRERVGKVLANVPDLNVLKLQSFGIRWTVSALDTVLTTISPTNAMSLLRSFWHRRVAVRLEKGP